MRHFTFNGIDSRDFGFALSIERAILPEISPITVDVPRKTGLYIPINKQPRYKCCQI